MPEVHVAEASIAEKALRALAASKTGVFEIDLIEQSFWCSDEFVEVIGRALTFEEAVAPKWPMTTAEDAADVEKTLLDWRTRGGAVLVRHRIHLPGGDIRWVLISADVVPDPAGRPIRISGIVRDIDDSQQRLAKSGEERRMAWALSERQRIAADAGRAGMYEVDYEAQTVWCSEEFAELVGRPITFAEANTGWAMVHEADRARVDEAVHRHEPRNEGTTLRDSIEFRVVLPNGRVRWLESRAEIHWGRAGAFQKVVGLVWDIDERKRQELALRAAREEAQTSAKRLRLALQAAGAGVYEVDYQAKTFWCSDGFVEVVGRSLTFAEATGECWPVIHLRDRALVARLSRRNRSAATGLCEARVVLPSGKIRWVRFYAEAHHGPDGEPIALRGLALDVDISKRQELALRRASKAAEVAAEAKSNFIANMSHELRTPMAGVLGILHVLEAEQLPPEAHRLVQEANHCGRMLAELLNDILDLSKIEAGKIELRPEAVDVTDVAASVLGLLRPQAEAKALELRSVLPNEPCWINVDSVRLRQALFNLVGNAVKFTSAGHVELRLTVTDASASRRRLRFEVEDTGVGISRAVQPRLFQRFVQADTSTSRAFGGSGLGLSITRHLARLMDGEVSFTSTEGLGSTFWLEICAERAEPIGVPKEPEVCSLAGRSILVVEDNPTNRLVATMILERVGARVQTAEDGLIALQRVKEEPFDLVLMDVQMPRMDGIEATRRIRHLPGPAGRVPIVGLTANVLEHQKAHYRAIGMDGVASKPISPAELFGQMTAAFALGSGRFGPGDESAA